MAGAGFTLRSASESDVPAVLGLIRGLAEYEHLAHELEATEERLRLALFPSRGRPLAECLLALEGAEAVGFAFFYPNFSTFLGKPGLFLEDLYVRPEHRRKGIGKALLLEVARLAQERGCGRMDWTVLDWNAPAIAFYRSLGAAYHKEWGIVRLTGENLARAGGSARLEP